jgi:hypothetical protein
MNVIEIEKENEWGKGRFLPAESRLSNTLSLTPPFKSGLQQNHQNINMIGQTVVLAKIESPLCQIY